MVVAVEAEVKIGLVGEVVGGKIGFLVELVVGSQTDSEPD